ncbi:uncharacterized protein LOC144682855 [Cetorhinus maximus]
MSRKPWSWRGAMCLGQAAAVRLGCHRGSPPVLWDEQPEGPPLTSEDHTDQNTPATILVHIGEGTSHLLEVQAEAECVQGAFCRRTAGDKDNDQLMADVPLESSMRQQTLDIQQGVREDLAEIHKRTCAMVSVVEKYLRSMSTALTLVAGHNAASMEKVAILMERLLQELNRVTGDVLRPASPYAGNDLRWYQCGKWIGHPVSQLDARPMVSREVQSDLMLAHELLVVSAGSSGQSSSSAPLPVTVASDEAAATGEMPAVAPATPRWASTGSSGQRTPAKIIKANRTAE